jgi:alpha-methylacyl-CoA racemase
MDLFDTLAALRVIAGPVLETNELSENVHLEERGFFRTPENGGPQYPGPAFQMSATPAHLTQRAPGPGDHTAEVLRDFSGLDESDIDALLASGVAK